MPSGREFILRQREAATIGLKENKVSLTRGKEKLGVFCLLLRVVWGTGRDERKRKI